MSQKEECLVKNCDNLEVARGLCSKHYQKYVYRIKTGKTSWEELESRGLIKPAQGSFIEDEPEQPIHRDTSRGELIVVHPSNQIKKPSKKEVLLEIKDILRDNDLDNLTIIIFKT